MTVGRGRLNCPPDAVGKYRCIDAVTKPLSRTLFKLWTDEEKTLRLSALPVRALLDRRWLSAAEAGACSRPKGPRNRALVQGERIPTKPLREHFGRVLAQEWRR